jgi:DNA-binding CsgD family transcriptional regulator
MISNRALVRGHAHSARHDDFAETISEVLRLGWSGHFSAAHSVLAALSTTQAGSVGERAMCRALLALVAAALADVPDARRLARRAISESARPPATTPAAELRWLRLARALAANASHLVGGVARAGRAAQAQFMAGDPDSAWLVLARVDPPWQEAPAAVQRYARFIAAVHERYAAQSLAPLTATEVAILRHLDAGDTAVRIAQRLGRSVHTVRTHLRNAYAKLGARGRGEAMFKARGLGLLSRKTDRPEVLHG